MRSQRSDGSAASRSGDLVEASRGTAGQPFLVALERYLDYLNSGKGVSPRTLGNYRRDLAQFVGFLGAEGARTWGEVERPLLRKWLSDLRSRGFSQASVARRASEARAFVRHVMETTGAAANPFAGLRLPRAQPAERRALSREEVARLLAAPDASPVGVRDRAVLATLYATGLRVSELVGLDMRQVDLACGCIERWDRRGELRVAFLGGGAAAALAAYLAEARPQLAGDKPERALFVAQGGRRLSARAVEHLVARHARSAGLRATPRDLRVACAAHLREGGASGLAVRALLGAVRAGRPPRRPEGA